MEALPSPLSSRPERSGAEGSAVPRTAPGNVFLRSGKRPNSNPLSVDLGSKPHLFQHPNSQVIHIQLVPSHPMASRNRKRVMVVMPPLTAHYQCNPPVVPRIVPRLQPPRTPDVRR